jgi:hypothetical protein
MSDPVEMKKPEGAAKVESVPANSIILLCPCCGVPYNPLLRMFKTPIRGTHLIVFGCQNCKAALNATLNPTSLLESSGLVGPDGEAIV